MFRRVGRDNTGLDANFAEHRHGRDVAAFRDFLEHERGVKHGQAETAIFLRHRHAEHAELGELPHVFPWEGAVHVFEAARLELVLRDIANGLNKPALIL